MSSVSFFDAVRLARSYRSQKWLSVDFNSEDYPLFHKAFAETLRQRFNIDVGPDQGGAMGVKLLRDSNAGARSDQFKSSTNLSMNIYAARGGGTGCGWRIKFVQHGSNDEHISIQTSSRNNNTTNNKKRSRSRGLTLYNINPTHPDGQLSLGSLPTPWLTSMENALRGDASVGQSDDGNDAAGSHTTSKRHKQDDTGNTENADNTNKCNMTMDIVLSSSSGGSSSGSFDSSMIVQNDNSVYIQTQANRIQNLEQMMAMQKQEILMLRQQLEAQKEIPAHQQIGIIATSSFKSFGARSTMR